VSFQAKACLHAHLIGCCQRWRHHHTVRSRRHLKALCGKQIGHMLRTDIHTCRTGLNTTVKENACIYMYTHAHAHTHTHTNTQTHKHTHKHTHLHTHTCTYAHKLAHMHACTHPTAQTPTSTQALVCLHTHMHVLTRAHPFTHAHRISRLARPAGLFKQRTSE
jgi:hypothetical protein